jgi:hypothetical protein
MAAPVTRRRGLRSLGEYGVCIDCGQHTELRLPRRFPHICTACLFLVDAQNAGSHQPELPKGAQIKPSLIDALGIRAGRNAHWRPPLVGDYGD